MKTSDLSVGLDYQLISHIGAVLGTDPHVTEGNLKELCIAGSVSSLGSFNQNIPARVG